MNKKALAILLLPILSVTMFAVTVNSVHAAPAASAANANGPTAYSVGPSGNFSDLATALRSGNVSAGDHLYLLAGDSETLTEDLTINISDLWIFGAPTGATPSINVNGYTINITASKVLVYGLDFNSNGMSPTCIALTSDRAHGCTIQNCTIRGSSPIPYGTGIEINDAPDNVIAGNTIRDWVVGIDISGNYSCFNLIRLNNITYNTGFPFLTYGVQVGGGAGKLPVPIPYLSNWVYWNNIIGIPSLGRELWDLTPGNPINRFDDIGLPSNSFNRGNCESSWAIPTPYPVAGPGNNGWQDRAPLTAPMSTLKCDANVDGLVDLFDAILVEKAYGSVWGSYRWDTRVNLNLWPDPVTGKQVVDIYDAITLASHFNQHYP